MHTKTKLTNHIIKSTLSILFATILPLSSNKHYQLQYATIRYLISSFL